jgi:hypothetical protein
MSVIYRYEFENEVDLEQVEASLILAAFAAESLHGEAANLDVGWAFDREERRLVIDAGSPSGRDFNRVFAGFLRREMGDEAFTVEKPEVPSA